jgi:hypothetical protein
MCASANGRTTEPRASRRSLRIDRGAEPEPAAGARHAGCQALVDRETPMRLHRTPWSIVLLACLLGASGVAACATGGTVGGDPLETSDDDGSGGGGGSVDPVATATGTGGSPEAPPDLGLGGSQPADDDAWQVGCEDYLAHRAPCEPELGSYEAVCETLEPCAASVFQLAVLLPVFECVTTHPCSDESAFDACVLGAGLEGMTPKQLQYAAACAEKRDACGICNGGPCTEDFCRLAPLVQDAWIDALTPCLDRACADVSSCAGEVLVAGLLGECGTAVALPF